MSSPFARLRGLTDGEAALTPETWRVSQPCWDIRLGSRTLVLSQPTSSVLVYLLGFLTLAMGLRSVVEAPGESPLLWWGVGLIFWGLGALIAGTSYQAFGFHIKCSGRSVCSWTSWWEVVYLAVQYWSLAALLVGVVAHRNPHWQWLAVAYGGLSSLVYTLSVLAGGLRPVRSWITFERLLLVSAPLLAVMIAINAYGWFVEGDGVDGLQLGAWCGLLLSIVCFFVWERAHLGSRLWRTGQGIWFSENDILHVVLLAWAAYLEFWVLPAL